MSVCSVRLSSHAVDKLNMCVPLSIDGCPINILIITCSIHMLCFVLIRLVRLNTILGLAQTFLSVCVFICDAIGRRRRFCLVAVVVVVVVVMDVHELHNKPRAHSHCLSSKLFI